MRYNPALHLTLSVVGFVRVLAAPADDWSLSEALKAEMPAQVNSTVMHHQNHLTPKL